MAAKLAALRTHADGVPTSAQPNEELTERG
jgi:hypothetical protein